MKRLFYIKNDSAPGTIPQVLSLGIGERHFSFAVTDKTGTELHSLAYYTTDETDGETLSSIYADHHELSRSFYTVQVSYDHSKNVMVPMQHFNADVSNTLLDSMHGQNGQSSVISEAVTEWQLYNVYAVPKDVQEWVSRKFPSAIYRHHFTLGIKSMPAGQPDRLLVNIHTDEFSFIAIKDNKLLIAQTHLYSSPEDICYYLLKTCHQFSLSQEQVQLTVSGLIEKESQLYREMYQFFVNVEFRDPTWNMPVIEEHEYPAHFFTTLNDLARCAS
ncbi:MAG TPA: DUF3822 family protein [Chitinophagaceae bacterium]